MNSKVVAIGAVVVLLAQSASAAEPVAPSKATRNELAETHQNIAKCLRSDRPYAECELLMATTRTEHSCPMMQDGQGHAQHGPAQHGPGQHGPAQQGPAQHEH